MVRRFALKSFAIIFLVSLLLSCVVACSDKHSHAYKSKRYNPTCTDLGVDVFTCECGDSFTIELPALGHTKIIDAAVEPTCDETGLTEGEHCAVCGEVLIKQEVVSASGHDYEAIVTEPTFSEQGFTTYTCHCGDSYIDDYTKPFEFVDYVDALTFNENSGRVYQEVTVKSYVDGDTTYFNLSTPIYGQMLLKAQYVAIDTPESTGVLEPYGKKAASFTKEKLTNATSIIVESDTETWDYDSTGDRILVWVWYKPADSNVYRNLNLEILQNGLAVESKTLSNSYDAIAMAALEQAKAIKYNVHSGEKDPDMYYGSAIPLTLRELCENIDFYVGKKVAFEGVVIADENRGVYVREYDEENDMYNYMYVYYGFGVSGYLLRNLSIGNRVRIVGTLSEYNGNYQVSGLSYDPMKPEDENNTIVLD